MPLPSNTHHLVCRCGKWLINLCPQSVFSSWEDVSVTHGGLEKHCCKKARGLLMVAGTLGWERCARGLRACDFLSADEGLMHRGRMNSWQSWHDEIPHWHREVDCCGLKDQHVLSPESCQAETPPKKQHSTFFMSYTIFQYLIIPDLSDCTGWIQLLDLSLQTVGLFLYSSKVSST